MTSWSDDLVAALVAIAAGRPDTAAAQVATARRAHPDRQLPAELGEYLARSGDAGVYAEPTAFEAFIDGGGNVGLYAATIGAVAGRSRGVDAMVDIGCGDGRVLDGVLDCLHEWDDRGPERIDLVEPSAELLHRAANRLEGRGPLVNPVAGTAQDLVAAAGAIGHWDLAVATYALSALSPTERAPVLATLARHTDRLVVAEFDVPAFADRSDAHARYVVERYEQGLAEYGEGSPVAQGFLMPVVVGQFDPTRPRLTYEQPVEAWAAELVHHGFATVNVHPVCDYWWAPAHLLDATPL